MTGRLDSQRNAIRRVMLAVVVSVVGAFCSTPLHAGLIVQCESGSIVSAERAIPITWLMESMDVEVVAPVVGDFQGTLGAVLAGENSRSISSVLLNVAHSFARMPQARVGIPRQDRLIRLDTSGVFRPPEISGCVFAV